MDHLPLGDAAMLASAINFLLRDGEYDDLDQICSSFDIERSRVLEILAGAGFSFSDEQNRVI